VGAANDYDPCDKLIPVYRPGHLTVLQGARANGCPWCCARARALMEAETLGRDDPL
jgi:hypothetical protein